MTALADRGCGEPAALTLEDVTVDVVDGRLPRRILDGVSLEVRAGELVAVMGPSGAGKSTLLDVACGLVRPTSGRVAVAGREPPTLGRTWWADRRRDAIGVVHQRANLLPGLHALDNAALALELRGRSRREARAAAEHALARVGIAHVAATPVDQLSIGEQQRVAVARALVGDRPLLLADEPSAALDRTAADELTRLLSDVARAGRAVLLVTHDGQQASWADRTLVLQDGRIVDRIEPSEMPAGAAPQRPGDPRP